MSYSDYTVLLIKLSSPKSAAQFFGTSDWIWIIIFILALMLVWWLMSRATDLSKDESEELSTNLKEEESQRASGEEVKEPDDLTRIEGIGPKINQILQEAGIQTFEQLSNSDPGTLQSLLDESRLSFADPNSWPEQAKLASERNWDELENLQEKLKGGRRE
jgi:predicted flap endonuclease-1-like 5' DNA nuclease